MLDDVRRLLDDDGLGRGAGARGQRPPGHRHRRAARRDRPPGLGQEDDPGAARGRPQGGRRPARRGLRQRQDPHPVRRPGRRRSRTPSPTPPASRRSWTPSSARPGCGPVARPAGRSPPGSPGSSPTRSSGSTSTSAPRAGSSPAAARTSVPEATQVQRARVDTEVRALADDVSAGLARPGPRPYAAPRSPGCPTSATASTRRSAGDRPGRREGPGLGRHRPGAPVGADPGRPRRGRLARCPRGAGLPAAAAARHPGRRPVPVPTLLLVGGVALGMLLALVCRFLVAGDGPPAGAGRRPAAAGGGAPGVRRSWSSTRSRPSCWRTPTVRTGLAKALGA